MAGSAAAGDDLVFGAGPLSQSRLVRQETALGTVRELVPADELIGIREFAPMLDIPTDDFVIQLANGEGQALMAPARADDAEAELFQTDDFVPGEFRGRTVDWAIKSRYSTSDVNTFRDAVATAQKLRNGELPLFVSNIKEGFAEKLRRDGVKRRDMLDRRLNWLIMTSMVEGKIAYNDGKIRFSIDWGRPADQHRQTPESGPYTGTTHDPINDIKAVKRKYRRRYGIELAEIWCSQDFLDTFWRSDKFTQIAAPGNTNIEQSDMPYLLSNWGPDSAVRIVEQACNVTFRTHDAMYRTRPIGSTTFTTHRWIPRDEVIFLPRREDVRAIDDTELNIGFGATLTSPHPAGNWTSGFYEWEKDYGVDPWGYAIGSGIKALPVFPHMELTHTWKVDLPVE